ncbi:terminal uridylyltransferase Tailor-like [Battus philenor]|uniref:terminal uridylyltransferase Tailor-like n=1 Tax=Battus philenor TaxID=42288 RepID=UPI0035D00274
MGDEEKILDISNLHLEGDFDHQVQQILQFIRLTRAQVEDLQILFDDVQNTLATIWPGCVVQPFGSIVTGLGIKSSDVDCYINLLPWQKNPSDIYVTKAKSLMSRRPKLFSNLFAITTAKVPIVKCYHIPTQRYCDISFKSLFGVQNSKLLAYLINLDSRAFHLAILVKYWSKVHNLTGTNLLPNYSLLLLVIFYLQQKSILPPIYRLQNAEYMVDNWNVAFDEIVYESDNDESLYNLLGEFFIYYRDFKYDQYIISPFLGRPIHKEQFNSVKFMTDQYSLYKFNLEKGICQPLKLNTLICVQDPFDHSRNCTGALHPKIAYSLLTHFKLSTDVFENERSDAFLWGILSIEIKGSLVTNTKKRVPKCIQKHRHAVSRKNNTIRNAFVRLKKQK